MPAVSSSEATVSFLPLHSADGSAIFEQDGFSIIGSVNGPIEIMKRDEHPEEAVVDVVVRPAVGVGGTRERHLESIIQPTLRQLILIQNYPRTLIQVTLQIAKTPSNETRSPKLYQASSNLLILPALLHSAVLTLLSASTPIAKTLSSTILATNGKEGIIRNPTLIQIQEAKSIHAFAFSTFKELLLAESEGSFSIGEWEELYEIAEQLCCGVAEDDPTQEQMQSMHQFIQSALREKIADEMRWKNC